MPIIAMIHIFSYDTFVKRIVDNTRVSRGIRTLELEKKKILLFLKRMLCYNILKE